MHGPGEDRVVTTTDDEPGLGPVELVGGPADGLRLLTTAGPRDLLCLRALAEEFTALHALRAFSIDRPHYVALAEPEASGDLLADYQQRPACPHQCGAGNGSTMTEENRR